ncbi:MAG: sodium/proline symporter, partial [Chlamydiia bacterium]|nr:sodium/proline symporter [Chlamydiia bacterium]
PELVFVQMVENTFPPFLMALILCGVLGATISTMDSQILVLASSLTEDFYKRIFHKNATSKQLLWVSRMFVLAVTAFAYIIAFLKISTIYSLVLYAWSGLGSAFGPLLVFSLYSKRANKYGAWAGVITGGLVSILWPLTKNLFAIEVPTMVPGFILSSFAIYVVSLTTKHKGPKYETT